MKIFISGIAGFLGSHLADTLIKEGHKVVGCDNLIGGYLDNVPEEVVNNLTKDYSQLMKKVDEKSATRRV